MIVKEHCIAFYKLYIQPIHETAINEHVELVNEFHMKLEVIRRFGVDSRPSVFNFLDFLPESQVEDMYLSRTIEGSLSADDVVLHAFYNSRICDDHAIFNNTQVFAYGHPLDPMVFAGTPPSISSLTMPSTPLADRRYQ